MNHHWITSVVKFAQKMAGSSTDLVIHNPSFSSNIPRITESGNVNNIKTSSATKQKPKERYDYEIDPDIGVIV